MRKRRFKIGVIILVLVFTVNHIEYYIRAESITKKPPCVIVRAEGGSAGHSTIGVEESSIASSSDSAFLHFSTLAMWEFDPKKPVPCPDVIKKLNGHPVTCIGFMYPLVAGNNINLFCLMRTTQTCCYGPRPQFNQYLFVEMKKPVKFERLKPIIVEGLFFVDPKVEDGYIFRLEGTSVSPVADDIPDIDAAEAAEKTGLPLFDFGQLEKAKNKKRDNAPSIPPDLRKLCGKTVVLEGFFVGSTKNTPPALIVGKYWWDGVMQGTPPGLYNAVMVFPRDDSEVPPAWKQRVVFTGALNITKDPGEYAASGIVSIKDATRGVSGTGTTSKRDNVKPFLYVWHELIILGAFFALALKKPGQMKG
ncbi:MAG: DUF3299 domain-containing protein [Pseudomonadota bacterium]